MTESQYGQVPPITSSTTAWLDSYAPPPPKPKKPIGKIIVIVSLIILLSIVVLIVMMAMNRPKPCLTGTDFTDLTGTTVSDTLDPTYNFYSTDIVFPDNSADYAAASGSDTVDIYKIIDFYKSHQNKSLIISVSTFYPKSAGEVLAKERINTIRGIFAQANVPPESLKLFAPVPYNPEPDGASSNGTTTISITSASSCSQ